MSKKKTPPAYGESSGPMIVACQWNISSPTGPAEQFAGGSFPKSTSSGKRTKSQAIYSLEKFWSLSNASTRSLSPRRDVPLLILFRDIVDVVEVLVLRESVYDLN